MINGLLPSPPGSPGSDLPGKAQELQEEEGGPGCGGAPTLPPHPPQAPLHVLSYGHSLGSKRSHRERQGRGPKVLQRRGPPAPRWWAQGSSDTVSYSVGLSSLTTALADLPPPCPAGGPSQFGPLSTSPVGRRPRAALQGPGGAGLGL